MSDIINPTSDEIIADLESRGLDWDVGNTCRLIEARIWDWPQVIGRYRPAKTEPLAYMLTHALAKFDIRDYPVISTPTTY